MSDYAEFVRDKFVAHTPSGIASGFSLPGSMFHHQSALTAWALRRGRAAVFADTGLGKMLIELAWADAVRRHTKRPVMIHTPLAVAAQIAAEGRRFGIEATVVREASELTPGINIANYERLHKFDTSVFGGVVLDESGCIKHHDAKTFRALTDAYLDTPFKLPASATPAPNDWTELGTHAEFLGVCTRAEMLAEFFTHDGGDTSVWRLKGHARQGIDYLVTMRAPGESERVTHGEEYPVDLWQKIASPVWMDINPSDTLQYRSAREHDDERHIAPLQLEVIRRGIMLWTNPGDIVLTPFLGIGSEAYVALQMGRRAVGVELKKSYFDQAVRNLASAQTHQETGLFADAEAA